MAGRTGSVKRMRRLGQLGTSAVLALLSLAIASAAASSAAAPGRIVVPMPASSATSHFGPIAPTADGGFLVGYVVRPAGGGSIATIERRDADGALDASFGSDGSVRVTGPVAALAADPGGGVIYSAGGLFARLRPDGTRDRSFRSSTLSFDEFVPKTIAFDAGGRIVVGGRFNPGARYRAHEGEAAVFRLEPDGRPDRSFGTDGVSYLGTMYTGGSGEVALRPDGSMLVVDRSLRLMSADGTLLAGPEPKLGGMPSAVAVFPDGGYATAGPPLDGPGCQVDRYEASGAPDREFARVGILGDRSLSGCRVMAAPDGGLLLSGRLGAGRGPGVSELRRITATGTIETSFGRGGSVTISTSSEAGDGLPWQSRGIDFGPGGRLVVAGGGSLAALVGLEAEGAPDPAFGNDGSGSITTTRTSGWSSWRSASDRPPIPHLVAA